MINDIVIIGVLISKEDDQHTFTLELTTFSNSKITQEQIEYKQKITCYIEHSPVLESMNIGDNIRVIGSYITRKEPQLTDVLVYSMHRIAKVDAINYTPASYNSALIVGRLGSQPRKTETAKKAIRMSFSLGVTRKNSSGEQSIYWINVVSYDILAIDMIESMIPGSLIMASGRLQVRTAEDGTVYAEIISMKSGLQVILTKDTSNEVSSDSSENASENESVF